MFCFNDIFRGVLEILYHHALNLWGNMVLKALMGPSCLRPAEQGQDIDWTHDEIIETGCCC